MCVLLTLQNAAGKKAASHKSKSAASAGMGEQQQQQQRVPAEGGGSGGESDGKCSSSRERCRGVSLRLVAWRASLHEKLLTSQYLVHALVLVRLFYFSLCLDVFKT